MGRKEGGYGVELRILPMCLYQNNAGLETGQLCVMQAGRCEAPWVRKAASREKKDTQHITKAMGAYQ